MSMHDILLSGLIQAAEIGGMVTAFYLAFGLLIVGLLALRTRMEER